MAKEITDGTFYDIKIKLTRFQNIPYDIIHSREKEEQENKLAKLSKGTDRLPYQH
jgi:hypothetical protein